MLAVNFFGFGTDVENMEINTESVSNIEVENISKELISSGAGDVLLFSILFFSVFFAFFVKKFA